MSSPNPNQFQETTSTNWFQRIGGSIKGIFAGIVLFLLAFPLLFWGEFRAVAQYKSLEAGEGLVTETALDVVDAELEGQLVHLTGKVTIDDKVTDPDFPITVAALSLHREVQMYQWEQTSSQTTRKKLGGGEETVTTYNYAQKWSDRLIDSGQFAQQQSQNGVSYTNPPDMRFDAKRTVIERASLGAHRVPTRVLGSIGTKSPVSISDETFEQIKSQTNTPVSLEGKTLYYGENPSEPQIGDTRVSFVMAQPGTISITAKQTGDSFSDFKNKNVKKSIFMVRDGEHTADEMFEGAKTQNTITTWIVRVIGFMMMFIGLSMVLTPLSVLGDVVPFIGSIIGAGISIVSFLIACTFTLLTIAIAWLAARPLIGILLLIAVGGLLFGLYKLRKNAKATPPPAAA